MGDRGNVYIEDADLYFYTHWYGSQLPKIVQETLEKKDRWTDEPYLSRMIFSNMIKDDVNGTAGFGISRYMCDNENPIVNVNIAEQKVTINDITWTFEDYIQQAFK